MYEVFGGVATRAFRVIWFLDELGEDFTHHDLKPRTPEILAVNPSGKVPAFRDGDTVITDSTAIMTYLADKHSRFTHPAGTLERAQQDAWTHRILDEIDGILWTAARHSFILPEDKRVKEVKPTCKWEFDRSIARISDEMVGPYLMGDEMLVPDFLLLHCLNWAHGAKFEVTDEKINEYAKRIRGREAFKAARARLKA